MGFLSGSLRNVVLELEHPESLWRIPEIVDRAIDEFAEDSPRLYRVHEGFFEAIREGAGELPQVFEELWRKFPHGVAKSIYICFKNRLSRWTDICVRVRSVKRAGELGVEAVTVDKMYRPEKYAAYLIELESPSPEELRRKIEEFKRKIEVTSPPKGYYYEEWRF